MKIKILANPIIILLLFLSVSINSCKKEERPTLTTSAITNILGISASSGGTITNEGSGTIIARGICWSTGTTPTIVDSKTTDGAGAGSFTSNLTGLNGATTYYVRAYATNNVGTGYGMAMSFTTLGQSPYPTGLPATNISVTSATLNGSVNANYLSTTVTFEYGTTTGYGSTATPPQSPVTGNTSSNVGADITGLTAGTIYHYRIKAVNSVGAIFSNDLTFTTLGLVPTVSTLAATSITSTSAILNGTVNANYLSTVITFEYGSTTSYGSTSTAIQSPLAGNTVANVSATIVGLTIGTDYHFRIKAVNSLGTTYGNDLTFTTFLADIDGNSYNIIKIGSQVWMAENLKTSKYNDGTNINLITDNTAWNSIFTNNLTTPAYCYYNNDLSNKAIYGALYNWYTVNSITNANKNICPTGWHVPKLEDMSALFTYLGGNNVFLIYGGKLKEIGTTHWTSPNTGATNQTGFTALPGGERGGTGAYLVMGQQGVWWTTNEENQTSGTVWTISFDSEIATIGSTSKTVGGSIRCLKD